MQNYLMSMLQTKLGTYLDGLDNTQFSYGIREASMSMTNVQFRRDALDKFLLPIDIKFGTIKKLTLKVPVLNINNSPVTIQLEGMDLILAPKGQEGWQFSDVFSEVYMKQQLLKMANLVIADVQSQASQGWKDRLKIRILDNFTMNIRDVHIRFEDISEASSQRDQIGQTTFGCLLSELDLKTVDVDGKAIFHDRTTTGGKITKILKLEGLAIYLNPQDTLIIHQIAAENPNPVIQISSMQTLMDKVVTPYRILVEYERDAQNVPSKEQLSAENGGDEDFLTYILKPMNMELIYEHETDTPTKSMKISIRLDKLELSLQHQQLKAVLKLVKTSQVYKQKAFMQEKLRKFRQFRPIENVEEDSQDAMDFGSGGIRPGFNAREWWQFAGNCIMRSIQFKKGSLLAFKIPVEKAEDCKRVFQATMGDLYATKMDDIKREQYFAQMEPASAKVFWHIVSLASAEQLQEWTKQIVVPIEEARLKKVQNDPNADGAKISRLQSLRNWFSKPADSAEAQQPAKDKGGITNPYQSQRPAAEGIAEAENEDDDDFDEFFDCVNDTEETVDMYEEQKRDKDFSPEGAERSKSKSTRDRTSFSLYFNIRTLSFTLGKLSTQNRIEGIQVYNQSLSIVAKAPSLNISQQFIMQAKIVEIGINLITMNRRTNMIEECLQVIHTNNKVRGGEDLRQAPQWDMTLTKNNGATSKTDIEFDLDLKIGQIFAKYNEDLVIRAKAISRIKVDQSLQTQALDQLEEFQENAQSAIHSLIYKRRNKYAISISSPILLLPINGTFEGAYSPIWAIRTGSINIASSEPQEIEENRKLFENLSVERQQPTQQRVVPQQGLNFAQLVRTLMRSQQMPSSRGSETERYFEHFKVTISQMGVTYFQSFDLYENHVRSLSSASRAASAAVRREAQPPKMAQNVKFPGHKAQKNADNLSSSAASDEKKVQSLEKFDVLDEFEINILVKIRKKEEKVVLNTEPERACFHSLPKILMRVDTSSINIRLSHSVYNNMHNLKNIFNISEERAAEYNKELTQFNVQIKQQLQQEAHMQGRIERKVFVDEQKAVYEQNHCLLSGTHLYFYKTEDSLLYIDYFYLKKSEMSLDMKNLEIVIHRFPTTDQYDGKSLRRSTAMRKRGEYFTYDNFEAGTARKLRFNSAEQMQAWADTIREVTMQLVLEWGDAQDITDSQLPKARSSTLDGPMAVRPLGGAKEVKLAERNRRANLNGSSQGKYALMELKTFQQNQMHGNFNEAVTTFMSTDEQFSDDTSQRSKQHVETDEDMNVVKVEMDISVPSIEFELMKLKLEPETGKVASPAVFESWVTYIMLGMSMWMEQRSHDQLIKSQINKISLTDETMVINKRLMTQTVNKLSKSTNTTDQQRLLGLISHKLGSNQNFDEPAMIVEKKTYKKLSPRFDGIYMHSDVKMANIQINFMPGTFNNILKLMRATKKQTRPVDNGFGAKEEYTEAAAQAESSEAEGEAKRTVVEGEDDDRQSSDHQGTSTSQDESEGSHVKHPPKISNPLLQSSHVGSESAITLQKHQNRRYSIDQEQKMLQDATDINENRNYDFDCKQESDRPMLVTCSMKKISIGMLHPDYQMELFRLHSNNLDVRYEVFYDHAEMACNFSRTTLYDLTGHPYSVSPKQFYKFVKRNPNLAQSPQQKALENPREMFYFNELAVTVYMLQSNNCPHKEPGFASKLQVRMDTMRVNYIQEIMLRFNDYFMEQFMDCFFMSDPYKDPKQAFDEIRSRDQIHVNHINDKTDFMFADEIGKMDVKITSLEMRIKDRPHSKDYLLFDIPLITCNRTKGTMAGLIPRQKQLLLQSESIWTRCPEVNFWFGRENDVKDLTVQDSRLSLLKRPFDITIEYKRLSGSEVIAKIPSIEMDKAAHVNLTFTPIELIWPQSIYTYMLQCGDLNFGYSDGLVEQYFFIKWLDMSEHYQNQVRIVSKHFDIRVPAFSITLQNSDGSYIAEMIWQNFKQVQKNYTDNDKEMNISCEKFYVLDKISTESRTDKEQAAKKAQKNRLGQKNQKKKRKLRQAVICPLSSPMLVNSHKIIHQAIDENADEGVQEGSQDKNLQIFTDMNHNGDKTNVINIRGLKIFLKFQTFIMMQAFMMNAFPSYKMDSVDKPNGFNEDPERANRMVMQLNISNSLICFLNKQGQDSILFKGDITIDMVQESIKRAKQAIEDLQVQQPRSIRQSQDLFPEFNGDFALMPEQPEDGISQNGSSTEDSSDKHDAQEEAAAQFNRIYDQKITMKNLTSFICSLEHLDGSQSFEQLKKREMMRPVDITFENKYLLKREIVEDDDDQSFIDPRSWVEQQRQALASERVSAVDNLNSDDDVHDQEASPKRQYQMPDGALMSRSVAERGRRAATQSMMPLGVNDQPQQAFSVYTGPARENWTWGVMCMQDALITDTILRISIQDVHLLYRLIGFSSDLIATESINKLKEIHENIGEREKMQGKVQRQKTENLKRPSALKLQPNDRVSSRRKTSGNPLTSYRTFTENNTHLSRTARGNGSGKSSDINQIKEVSHSDEEEEDKQTQENEQFNSEGQEIFDGLIDKLENRQENSMASQIQRLTVTTTAFRKIANGYTQKKYLKRNSFFDFLTKDVLKPGQENDEEDFKSAEEGEISSDNDNTGEEVRRKTILRINQRKGKFDPLGQQIEGKRQDEMVEDPSGHQSDILDENSATPVNNEMFGDRQGPSKKKSSRASSSMHQESSNFNSNFNRDNYGSSESRQSHRKESVQDALSEFWQSCGGGSLIQKTRPSPMGQREKGLNTVADNFAGSDDEHPQGEIIEEEESKSYEPSESRSTTQFLPFGAARVHRNNGVRIKSASFGVDLRPTQERAEPVQSINGSVIGEKSRAFFQENETMLGQTKREDMNRKYKHCMENVVETKSEMLCKKISFLFINDFNSAFTPVMEVEMTGVNVEQNVLKADDVCQQTLKLHQMTGNYFNLELGEWEPFIENLALDISKNQTLSQQTIFVNFVGPVIVNLTQACVRNFSYTHEAWMSMPGLNDPEDALQPMIKQKQEITGLSMTNRRRTNNLKMNVHTTDSQSSFSINSDSTGEREQNKKQEMSANKHLLQTFEPIREEGSKMNDSMDLIASKDRALDQIEPEEVIEDNSGMEQITPFQIKNFTTFNIQVFEGGIAQVQNYGNSTYSSITQLQKMPQQQAFQGIDRRTSKTSGMNKSNLPASLGGKVFRIDRGEHSGYSVQMSDLLDRQESSAQKLIKAKHQLSQVMLMKENDEQYNEEQDGDDLERGGLYHTSASAFDHLPTQAEAESMINGEETDARMAQSSQSTALQQQISFKNAVVVGVQLNAHDVIQTIDMNEISQQDPYVYWLTSRYMLQRSLNVEEKHPSGSFDIDGLNITDQLLGDQPTTQADEQEARPTKDKVKYSQFLEKVRNDEYGYYDQNIFYGVVLNKMQKQLVIRNPYVFYNRTLLNIEVVIRKTPQIESIFSSAIKKSQDQELANEKARFVLEPEQKFPLDPLYYYGHSIKVRVFDQCSVVIEEKGHNQQMSIYKKSVNNTTQQQNQSAAGSQRSSVQQLTNLTQSMSNNELSNQQLFQGRGFSKDVSIEGLTKLDQGPGVFVAGPESDSLCMSIKRQPGELRGTTDIVFLPTLSVKNVLPCDIKIKRRKRTTTQEQLQHRLQQQIEEKTYYLVQKSEQKDFYTFDGTGANGNEIDMHIQVDGFLLSEQIALNQGQDEERELEIEDAAGNRLTIGMRIAPFKAGYQVTFFAHACILLETVRLLNSNSIQLFYEADSIKQQIKRVGGRLRRQKLAGQDNVDRKRYVMCNKDQSIVLSVQEGCKNSKHNKPSENIEDHRSPNASSKIAMQQDYFGSSVEQSLAQSQVNHATMAPTFESHEREAHFSKDKNLFFSPGLNIKQAGELTDFTIRTESTEQMATGSLRQQSKIQHVQRKYDFQMNVSLELADFEEKIFTKLIVISPKYVLVNQMTGSIEVAQINTQHMPGGCIPMEQGDRREWVWNDYSKESLICVRKSGCEYEDSFVALSSGDEEDSDENAGNQIMEENSRVFQKDETSDDDFESNSDDEEKLGSYDPVNLKAKKHASARLLVGHSPGDSRELDHKSLRSMPGKRLNKKLKKNGVNLEQSNHKSSGKKSRFSKQKSRTTQSRKLKRKIISESGWTEVDKVLDWEWSRGFSPAQNEQMTMAIMIRESENSPNINGSAFNDMKSHKVKVIRVTKKLMNNTVFVIFEDEHELFPMYCIINECRTVKVELRQYEMNEPMITPETIDYQQKMIFGFYEPENDRKIQLDLLVNRNNIANPLQQANFEYLGISIVDLVSQSNKYEQRIPYIDYAGQQHEVILTVTNDGQTQTIILSVDEYQDYDGNDRLLDERFKLSILDQQQLAKQEDEDARKKLKKEAPNTLIQVKLDELLVSFIAKVQKSRTEHLLIEENAELALFTWQKINFTQDTRAKEGRHNVKLSIGHFQIDNQMTWNPLFQQIFRAKRYRGARHSRRGGEEAQSSTQFFNMELDYRVDPEKPVTIVDRLVCTVAESCLCIESDFLVNWGYAVTRVRPYFENVDTYIHPLFTKNSICEIKDQEVEDLNMCESVITRNSSRIDQNDQTIDVGIKNGQTVLPFQVSREQQFEIIDLEAPLLSNENYRLSPQTVRSRSDISAELDFSALQQARKANHKARERDVHIQCPEQKDLLTNVMGEILINDKQCLYTVTDAPTHLRRWYQQNVTKSKETLYLREFLIDQVNMDLSFVVKTADSTNSGTSREHAGPLQYLKMSGLNLINIDEARFRIDRFGLQNYCIGKDDIWKQLSDFYGQSMVAEVKKMVGSVGIIGSPRTLFYSLGDGFHDFIAMPLDGFAEANVLGATYGFAAGSMSLTKQISLGSLQALQQFFRDASQLLLLVSKDKDYMRRREDRMIIEKPQHFVDGFGYGANSLIQSLKSGVTGIITRPYVEIRRRGVRGGLPTGIYQSIIGPFTKPVSGVFDLASKSAEGIKNTIRGFDVNTMNERVRQPRTFYGIQRKIKKYNRNDALLVGEFLMQVGEGRFADNHFLETKLIRSTRQNAHLLMLTEEQLFLVEANQKELVWNIKTELIAEAHGHGNGIVIFLMQEYEGQESVSLEVDASSRHEIENWLNAIASEFN